PRRPREEFGFRLSVAFRTSHLNATNVYKQIAERPAFLLFAVAHELGHDLRHLPRAHAHGLGPRPYAVASRSLRRIQRFVRADLHLFREILPALDGKRPVAVSRHDADANRHPDLLVVHPEDVL